MKSFFLDRGPGLATIVLIMLIVSLAQSSISSALSYGTLVTLLNGVISPGATNDLVLRYGAPIIETLRIGLVVAAAALYFFKRKKALAWLIVIDNCLFTAGLLSQTSGLLNALFGSSTIDARALMRNVVFMIVSNILIFSVWYWMIDPPGVEGKRQTARWEFLFPQRAGPVPHYEDWQPHYVDYLFLAFMTNFAFSPTDTLPLTARAKLLMLLQSTISVIALVVIASGGINILSGAK